MLFNSKVCCGNFYPVFFYLKPSYGTSLHTIAVKPSLICNLIYKDFKSYLFKFLDQVKEIPKNSLRKAETIQQQEK